MSARVTSAEVITLLGNDCPSGVTDVSSFINVANIITNQLIGVVDNELLQPIELYISAHLVAKRGLSSTEEGEAKDQFYHKAGFGLYLTEYGQMALALSNGKLETVASTEDKEIRINYVDRA